MPGSKSACRTTRRSLSGASVSDRATAADPNSRSTRNTPTPALDSQLRLNVPFRSCFDSTGPVPQMNAPCALTHRLSPAAKGKFNEAINVKKG